MVVNAEDMASVSMSSTGGSYLSEAEDSITDVAAVEADELEVVLRAMLQILQNDDPLLLVAVELPDLLVVRDDTEWKELT